MTKLAILANLERNLVKFVKLVMQKNDMRKVRILRIPTIISANFYEGQKRTMLEREGTKKEQVKMVACTKMA